MELQHARDSDLRQYQLQLSTIEEELKLSLEAQQESSVTMETNQQLALELEKEKGRLAGLYCYMVYRNKICLLSICMYRNVYVHLLLSLWPTNFYITNKL